MNSIAIKSVTGQVHNTGFGGYPYKIVCRVEIPVVEFNKLCKVTSPARSTICGRRPASRDLGSLVIAVNNLLYAHNGLIPAHNPSIDSQGSKRAKNGIKTMEFVYFFNDHGRAEALGFQLLKLKNGEVLPKYNQYVTIGGA